MLSGLRLSVSVFEIFIRNALTYGGHAGLHVRDSSGYSAAEESGEDKCKPAWEGQGETYGKIREDQRKLEKIKQDF